MRLIYKYTSNLISINIQAFAATTPIFFTDKRSIKCVLIASRLHKPAST
ncbi:hypothetical protein [Mucilaginibacter arboris]|uniref:Uncharacterized protein n=1 Tax=Mucilaginibacter arboris TaxID=2682090 RepID=A0A7K1SXN3_9SPHI|nr:hypothetical protein [Mucilaginibacter arboris]MVN22091.1 hypothetical protein [Mucilaginibacter arboris]